MLTTIKFQKPRCFGTFAKVDDQLRKHENVRFCQNVKVFKASVTDETGCHWISRVNGNQ